MAENETGKVLITGANGLVGDAVCDLFYRSKIPFTAISRKNPAEKKVWKTIAADIENDNLEEVIDDKNIETIVHCAAAIPGKDHSFEDCFKTNTRIDERIAEFAVGRKIREIIFISTTNLYGAINETITEDTEPAIENLYAQGKINSESLFSSNSDFQSSCLRINAPYGSSRKNVTVLSLFINQALQNEDIKYHGSGARRQDFTHTFDIARAVLKCFQKKRFGIYNIAGGQPIAMKDLAEMIVSLVPGSKSRIYPSGIDDPQENYRADFDLKKAETDLDWRAEISLKQGVSDWIELLRK